MVTITDRKQIDRLEDFGIVIEDIFLRKGKRLIRSSDGKMCDQVYNAPRIEKRYYHNNKCIYRETKFDKNANYTFATYNKNDEIVCPSCSNKGKIKDFYDGCPYCKTNFNIDYGLKRFELDPLAGIFNATLFKIIVGVVTVGMLIILNLLANFDITTLIMSIFMFPLFIIFSYMMCSMALLPIVIIKLITNTYHEGKRIRKNIIDRKDIMNCLNYELRNYYYNCDTESNLIDFDITKYYYLKDTEINNTLYVDVKYKIRKYYFINGRIEKKIVKQQVTLRQNNINNNPSTHNIKICNNCGASIDVTNEFCEFCRTKQPSISKWVIDKFN